MGLIISDRYFSSTCWTFHQHTHERQKQTQKCELAGTGVALESFKKKVQKIFSLKRLTARSKALWLATNHRGHWSNYIIIVDLLAGQ